MLRASDLVAEAVEQTGLEDFGGESFREGLELLTESLSAEADLTELGEEILRLRLRMLLANRLRVEDVHVRHPAVADQVVEGPLVIIGLPRTGTTALSQLVSTDPQIRSLRLWESTDPVPPPESATEHSDPRIADAARGLEAMYEAFPRMKSMYFQTATGATECQDLLGMEFRTAHFDGMAHVPRYTDVGRQLRHGSRLPIPPKGAAAPAMALPTTALAPEDPRAHAGPGPPDRGLPRCPLPLDPP